MSTETSDPEYPSLIDTIALTNRPLARMLASLDFGAQCRQIEQLFVDAYYNGEDDEALVIFSWVTANHHTCDSAELKRLASSIAAHQLSYKMAPGEGIWPMHHPMPKTNEVLAQALAFGMMTGPSEEGAAERYTVLHKNFQNDPAVRAVILAALKAATGKDCRKDRILQFIGYRGLPEEIRRVLMNAWMRNSDDASVVRVAEIAALLEECPNGIYDFVKNEIGRLKEVEAKIASIRLHIWTNLGMDLDVAYDPERAVLKVMGRSHEPSNEPIALTIQTKLLDILKRWSDKIMLGRTVATSIDVRVDAHNDKEWYLISKDRVMRLGNHLK